MKYASSSLPTKFVSSGLPLLAVSMPLVIVSVFGYKLNTGGVGSHPNGIFTLN